MRKILVGMAVTCAWLTQCAILRADDCSRLATLKLEATTITRADAVAAGSLEAGGLQINNLPAMCRVQGIIKPSSDSQIRFEVWMPESGWNQRFLGVGNGGFAGSIAYSEMAAYVTRGFAAAGSDAGHQGAATDATFAYHHPEKVIDFGWRAVHLTRERAREIVKAYYGKTESKAYFDSCSDGGREALMEAQRFPNDYDGILAGAPANAWSSLLTSGIGVLQKMLLDPRAWIPPRKLAFIQKAALDQCDQQDGVEDGVVGNPEQCHFNPDVLLCKAHDTSECLTAPQIQSLKILYAGATTRQGKSIFPGFTMGDEASWREWVVGDDPGASLGARFLRNNFRYIVTGDPAWNMLTADRDAMLKLSVSKTSADLDSTDPNLAKFAAHGGKLILYHGWNDPAISPWNTIAYYKQVRKTMGAESEDKFVRLYMVPGMEHCIGGPGASVFGQFSTETAAEPKHGIFDALQNWVENGSPDTNIVATKYDSQRKVPFTRPLCTYPKVAKYKGAGDINSASNFACVTQ